MWIDQFCYLRWVFPWWILLVDPFLSLQPQSSWCKHDQEISFRIQCYNIVLLPVSVDKLHWLKLEINELICFFWHLCFELFKWWWTSFLDLVITPISAILLTISFRIGLMRKNRVLAFSCLHIAFKPPWIFKILFSCSPAWSRPIAVNGSLFFWMLKLPFSTALGCSFEDLACLLNKLSAYVYTLFGR